MTAPQPAKQIARELAESLRVAVISDSPPERNGVGSYYADLVTQLTGYVDRSVLMCPKGVESTWNRYLLPPLPGDRTQKVWLPNPVKLWRDLGALKPHVVIIPTPGPYGLMGLTVARMKGIPVISGYHTSYEALAGIYWAALFGSLSEWYLSRCNRVLFSRSALVLANSPDMMARARQFGAARAELMGTSVSERFISSPVVPASPELTRVLFVGRLAEEKNIPALLNAAAALPQLHFTIAGDGPLRPLLEDASRRLPNLDFRGWQPRDTLVDIIDEHDLLLLPSHIESFGTVALEAMSRGRLVLVSRTCGITDWPDLAAGLFIIADDETPADALRRIAALPQAVRLEQAARAHRTARKFNEWNLQTWINWLLQSQPQPVD